MTDPNIVMYGTTWCGDCKRAKKFFGEQMIHFRWVDIDKDADARAYVMSVNDGKRSVPTIVFGDGSILVEPTDTQLAKKLGLATKARMRFYDLIVIGGGACGLTAANYAARDRIETLVVERSGLGGQASITDVVENVAGFAQRLSGEEFAKQLVKQAHQFGAEILQADVERIEIAENYRVVHFTDGTACNSRALLIATGATWRKLNVPGEDALIGRGVHYCASCDAPFYRGARELAVVGGGTRAVQEAIALTAFGEHVVLWAPEDHLTADPGTQDKLSETPGIEVRYNTTVTEVRGQRKLETVVTRDNETGAVGEFHPDGIFVFIGHSPNNNLVQDLVALDPEGYILTGHELVHNVQERRPSKTERHIRVPHTMETSVRGVFAAGDVRSGSLKQVADAVGEGASAVIGIREYLKGD